MFSVIGHNTWASDVTTTKRGPRFDLTEITHYSTMQKKILKISSKEEQPGTYETKVNLLSGISSFVFKHRTFPGDNSMVSMVT